MQIYKTFNKAVFEAYIKKFGFTSIDDNAFMKMVMIIETLVYNILNNVLHLTDALDKKIVKKAHLQAVVAIIQDFVSAKQSGGHAGTVLPSEYFGVNSNRYFDDVSSLETSMFSEGLARSALDLKLSGGAGDVIITLENFKTILDEYRRVKNVPIKIEKAAFGVIALSVTSNLDNVLELVDKKNKKLTLAGITNVLKKHCKQFSHLSYVWKN